MLVLRRALVLMGMVVAIVMLAACGRSAQRAPSGADTAIVSIASKGHSWPGSAMPAHITTRDIDATDAIWEFFTTHPKP